jgi:sigma-E factor negative regulatory protein RseB
MRALPLFAGLWVAGSAVAGERPDAAEWLLKASDGGRHASYQGVVVYREEDLLESLRISHRFKNGREQERLTSLTGRQRDVIREDDHVVCVLPQEPGGGFVDPAPELFPAMTRDTLKQVAGQYEIKDLGEARVAGRAVRGVAVAPRDQFRYGYEIWADSATAVPLKVSLMDGQGRAVEQLMFTEVNFSDAVPDGDFTVPAGAARAPVPAAQPVAAHDVGPGVWVLDHLPPGFKVTMRVAHALPGNSGSVEHLMLSDGLSAISVFSSGTQQLPQKMYHGMSHMGATHAYGRMVGTYHVTVVGEVPQATVRLIGDGLRPSIDAANDPPHAN